jgi:hypothetical protein
MKKLISVLVIQAGLLGCKTRGDDQSASGLRADDGVPAAGALPTLRGGVLVAPSDPSNPAWMASALIVTLNSDGKNYLLTCGNVGDLKGKPLFLSSSNPAPWNAVTQSIGSIPANTDKQIFYRNTPMVACGLIRLDPSFPVILDKGTLWSVDMGDQVYRYDVSTHAEVSGKVVGLQVPVSMPNGDGTSSDNVADALIVGTTNQPFSSGGFGGAVYEKGTNGDKKFTALIWGFAGKDKSVACDLGGVADDMGFGFPN